MNLDFGIPKFRKNKKASFFSMDALIAVMIILFVIIVAKPLINYVQPESEINSDVLAALSNLKVSEIDDVTVQAMIAGGEIRNPENTLLEQIGEFYIYDLTKAKLLAGIALNELETNENVGIWYGDDLIFSTNKTSYENAKDVDVARQVISGIEAGKNITGFSARASLASDYRTNYFYFGGYVGDGNVSILVDYQGNITEDAEMELVINTSNRKFDFYVNGNFQGTFNASAPYEPVHYVFPTDDFSSGFNLLEFRGKNLYIAGGYVKIAYRGQVQFGSKNQTYYFPGINGLVNLYDGFFVPQNLTSMEISLHLNSNYTMLLNIGNVSVYNSSTSGEESIFLSDAFLSSKLDYSELEGKTIPLRFGLENATYLGIVQKIDIFSVTDLSGSMIGAKLTSAKSANNLLIDFILNTTENRVGLVGYDTTASYDDYHPLSEDVDSLKDKVNDWQVNGYTCICCGIEKAIYGFAQTNSNEGRLIAYYNFNDAMSGSVADRSGLGNNGAVLGNPTSTAGISGNAFNLDGSGDYVSVPDIFEGTKGTISLWFDPDDGTSRTIFDASTSSRDFYSYLDGQRDIRFNYQDAGGSSFTGIEWSDDSANIENSGWHNIVFTWRFFGGSPSGELYYDGNLVDSNVEMSGNIPDFLGVLIGKARTGGSSASDFDGKIDEFRIYTKVLNVAEINALHDTTPACGNGLTEVGEVCDGNRQLCTLSGDEGTQACNAGCDGFLACDVTPVCGDGAIAGDEECDDGNEENGDGCSGNCTAEDRFKSMVVMSDGQANRGCTGDHADSVDVQEAIDKSIEACEDYGIVVNAVGFGLDADEATMTAIANNGCGGRYYYSDTADLEEVYRQIAQDILTEYNEQTVSVEGADVNTILYPDSYIKFNYTELKYPYGLILTAEAKFSDERGGSFFVPNESTPLITSVVSYSGAKWTSDVKINSNEIFDLDSYGLKYIYLGDPYRITTTGDVVKGINFANITTGVSSSNKSFGSEFDKVIFTVAKNASSYSRIVAVADGCVWTVQMEDGSFVVLRMPSSYLGSEQCSYNETALAPSPPNPPSTYGVIFDDNDAYQLAVLNLLRELDLDKDGRSDVGFTSSDFSIGLDEFSGIPFSYYTTVEARRWI